jgi:hypothetical protein
LDTRVRRRLELRALHGKRLWQIVDYIARLGAYSTDPNVVPTMRVILHANTGSVGVWLPDKRWKPYWTRKSGKYARDEYADVYAADLARWIRAHHIWEFVLLSCGSASGVDSIARQLSQLLPDVTIWGAESGFSTYGNPNAPLPETNWGSYERPAWGRTRFTKFLGGHAVKRSRRLEDIVRPDRKFSFSSPGRIAMAFL